jgi:hypothetical protein
VIRAVLTIITLVMLMAKPVMAQHAITERIQLTSAISSKSASGIIKGYETINYALQVLSDQTVTIALESDNLGNYFNIFEPGKLPGQNYAMFIGSTSGNKFEGTLPVNGDYLIQVYIIRSAARRDETANFSLQLTLTHIDEE